MDTKIYFDVEKISVIEVRPETLSDYVFYPEKPAYQRHIFGFIPSGKNPYLPPRWSSDEGWFYKTDEDLRSYNHYRIDDVEKKIYHRARVVIHLGYKESVNRVFDSTDEAMEWADHIIRTSGKNLELLIK
jgi:hypothetical protein